ncbi:MAG TPA: biliverdin-producing heme oxygenase [Propionibacteriaceae bacterium]|nr:biliverdin-producing heme oxygenase [Propionibacteriaceae bacterium]
MTLPLSEALRHTTMEAHRDAETSSFISELMEGRSCRAAFTMLAVQQLVIYEALEAAVAKVADHPLVAPLADRRLDRVESLRHDLTQLAGPDYRQRILEGRLPVVPATDAYAAVLTNDPTPERVLANHYVRYLGDLSGGQAIAALVRRHYGIEAEALTFYQFDGIGPVKPFKDGYRAALDALTPTTTERAAILDAAVESFRLNEAVFANLAGSRQPLHTRYAVAV